LNELDSRFRGNHQNGGKRTFYESIKIKTIQEPGRKTFTVSLKIKLRDGRVLEQEGDRSPGITNWEELVAKYRDYLGGVLPAEQIQQSLQMIQQMEKVKDISEVIKALVPG